MALTLKDPEVEALASEVSAITGETETEAVRQALLERRDRVLLARKRNRDLDRFLETQVWPLIPPEVLGKEVTKEEVEEYLGFGPGGV